MKTSGRPLKKTSDKRKIDSKKPDKKSFDKPKFSRSSDSKFKKTDSDTDFKKKSYSDRTGSGDKVVSEKRTYKKRETESRFSDKPAGHYSDKRSDDNKFSDKRPYKPRDTEKGGYDKPVRRYDDTRKRDDEKSFDKKSYKPRDTDRNNTDRPTERYSDKRRTDDNKYGDKRTYKPRDTEKGGSDRPARRYDDRNRDDKKFSDKRPFRSRDNEKDGSDRPVERYSDSRKQDDRRFSDKKPFKSREIRKDDKDRPIEKYVDQRRSNDHFEDNDRKFSDHGKKRPRIVETKTYEGRVREYRETEILVKDNTYEKRRSFNQKSSREGIRLNKFIANAGICSRREADTLIEAGAISINGTIVTRLGTKVMPDDQVKYGDQLLAGEQLQYLLLNKPKGYLTTTDDPQERKTVMMIVESACKERIYPVGRLDKNTSGLLLFTNDGELAKKLTHPKYQVEKIYHAELDKALSMADMKKIAEGIELEDGFIKIDAIAYGETKKEVGIELHSGKNRIVRRIFESLGYDVVKLDRVVFAGLTKKELPRGKFRFLSNEEVNILRRIR
jgi:23S rRNA pseudouridine2605 synthase